MKTDLQNKLAQFQKLFAEANESLNKKLPSSNIDTELALLGGLLKNLELTVVLAELETDDIFKPQTAASAPVDNLKEVITNTIQFYIALIQAENLFHKYSPDRLPSQKRTKQREWKRQLLQLAELDLIDPSLKEKIYEVTTPSAIKVSLWVEKSKDEKNPQYQRVDYAELDAERDEMISKINSSSRKLTAAQQKFLEKHKSDLQSELHNLKPSIAGKRIQRAQSKLSILFPTPEDPEKALIALAKKAHDQRVKRRKLLDTRNGMFGDNKLSEQSSQPLPSASQPVKKLEVG